MSNKDNIYVKFNKETGKVSMVIKRPQAIKSVPTLTEGESEVFTLAKIDMDKLPEGQVLGFYKVDIKAVQKGKIKFIELDTGVKPIELK